MYLSLEINRKLFTNFHIFKDLMQSFPVSAGVLVSLKVSDSNS